MRTQYSYFIFMKDDAPPVPEHKLLTIKGIEVKVAKDCVVDIDKALEISTPIIVSHHTEYKVIATLPAGSFNTVLDHKLRQIWPVPADDGGHDAPDAV